jgi:hypothetical protein
MSATMRRLYMGLMVTTFMVAFEPSVMASDSAQDFILEEAKKEKCLLGACDDPVGHDAKDDKGGLRAAGLSDDPADHDAKETETDDDDSADDDSKDDSHHDSHDDSDDSDDDSDDSDDSSSSHGSDHSSSGDDDGDD